MSLNVFATQITALGATIASNVVKLHQAVVISVTEDVATSTPVLTGQAAGNWLTSIGSPKGQYVVGASTAQSSVAMARAAVATLAAGQTVYITNNVPYIKRLNQGYSQQAPALFVEVAAVNALAKTRNFNLLIK